MISIIEISNLSRWFPVEHLSVWIAWFSGGVIIASVAWFSYVRSILKKNHDQDRELIEETANHRLLQNSFGELEQDLNVVKKELENSALLDSVTNLLNRKNLNKKMDQEWKRSYRTKRPLGLCILELDFFQDFMRQHGHGQATSTMKKIANIIRQSVNRPADIVARYDDNRYAVLLPETATQGALQVGNQIQEAVEKLRLPNEASTNYRVITVSCGVVSLIPEKHASPANLFAMAERALLQAKNQGNNCVSL